MRNSFTSMLVIAIAMASFNSNAQVKAIDKTSQKLSETNASVSTAANTAVNTAATVKTTFNLLKDITGIGKKGAGEKTVPSIFIAGIKNDNAVLLSLQQSLESIDGVKKISKAYKDGVVTLIIELSKKATLSGVWDKVPANFKTNLELVEMEDNSIVLTHITPEQSKAISKQ